MSRASFVSTSILPLLRTAAHTARSHPHQTVHIKRIPSRCILPEIPVSHSELSLVQSAWHALSSPLFAPLNECTPPAVRTIVWLNFRAAVALFVVCPLSLFAGTLARGPSSTNDALTRVLGGYWQASALLLFAVLLNAGNRPSAAFAGLLVQLVVPLSLNWWSDLLEEIENESNWLEHLFRIWRPIATAAALLGTAVQTPFQRCNFLQDLGTDCMCVAWTEPPVRLLQILAGDFDQRIVGALGEIGSAIYLAYLAYFVTTVLPRVGRSGRKDREVFSAVSVLGWLGWIESEREEKKTEESR